MHQKQDPTAVDKAKCKEAKAKAIKQKREDDKEKLSKLKENSSTQMQKVLEVIGEKGASQLAVGHTIGGTPFCAQQNGIFRCNGPALWVEPQRLSQ